MFEVENKSVHYNVWESKETLLHEVNKTDYWGV